MPDLNHELEQAKTHLLEASAQLKDEINNYPVPIAGCDAQFDYLLTKQKQVLRVLQILNEDL